MSRGYDGFYFTDYINSFNKCHRIFIKHYYKKKRSNMCRAINCYLNCCEIRNSKLIIKNFDIFIGCAL